MGAQLGKEVAFRVLSPEEHALIAHLFEEQGGTLPPPDMSIAVVGEADGEIVFGCIPVTAVFAEHLYVAPQYSGTSLWREGCEAVERELRGRGVGGFFVLAPDARIAHMAEEFGMEELPLRVFRKVLE